MTVATISPKRRVRAPVLFVLVAFVAMGCHREHDADAGHAHAHDQDQDPRVAAGPERRGDHDHPAAADAASHDEHEGRTRIAADIAAESGIVVAAAGPGVIRDSREVQGLLLPVEGHHAHVVARFPGPIRALHVGVGDQVRRGQVLARVESNISLTSYAVTAPIAGSVLARNVTVGDLAGDAPLFEIADLSTLWVDLHLFGADIGQIRPGLPVRVVALGGDDGVDTTVDRVLPATATASQSTIVRASLDNASGLWRPGAAVQARVTVAEQAVDLVLPLSALQRFRDRDVAFVQVGVEYEARTLQLGRRDDRQVEILAGLEVGALVVVEQSYLIKADIEKAAAAHEH